MHVGSTWKKNHCEWVTVRNSETVASIRPNFRKKQQQPTQILELNAGYYLQSAADKVRIWNEVHYQDAGQSLSLLTESKLLSFNKPSNQTERKEERKKERKAHSPFKTHF
jgi:hypothetical protein